MNRTLLIVLLALVAMGVSGCAGYEERAMSGNAVDIPDDTRWPQ